MTYDDEGNLVTRQKGSTSQTLTWNALGQLVSVTTGGQTVSYGYDGLGRRVLRTAGGTSTGFLYDGDHLMLEFDAAGDFVSSGCRPPASRRSWWTGEPKRRSSR